MVFELGFVFALTLASCMAEAGYPSVHPNEQLPYNQGYNYQDPRDQSDDDGLPGVAGKDYPIFREVPQTRFECEQQQYPGYYADPEAECQAFHICQRGGRKDSFLCPNGTLFNQARLVCEWWYNVDCSNAPSFYSINEEVAKAMEEADRRIRLAAEEKLSHGYQRGPNVDAGQWNKYNQQNVKQGWNDSPVRRNPGFAKDLTYGAPAAKTRPVYGAPEPSAKYLPSANNRGNSYSPEQNYRTTGASGMSDFAKDLTYEPPAAATRSVYGAPEPSAKYLPSANNRGNSYSPEQNYKVNDANRMSDFAKDRTYGAPAAPTRPVYGAPEFSAKSAPNANNHDSSYAPEQNYAITDAKFGEPTTKSNYADPANVYLPA